MMTVGIDLVRVSRVAESLAQFGERFLKRVFTDGEIAYATASPAMAAERLAARFAAKEAALQALGFIDGGSWRQIEVTRQASGRCELSLHGAARDAAAHAGVTGIAVSLSHEGDYATAVVVAMRNQEAA
jgi:holo-[acyl-carrier protein] synthase